MVKKNENTEYYKNKNLMRNMERYMPQPSDVFVNERGTGISFDTQGTVVWGVLTFLRYAFPVPVKTSVVKHIKGINDTYHVYAPCSAQGPYCPLPYLK